MVPPESDITLLPLPVLSVPAILPQVVNPVAAA
jgi:hypothetical protein